MRVAVIDADLIGRKKHRFPNLACMKLSAWHKEQGDAVILKTDYEGLDGFDKVYVSKVFTDTPVPDGVLTRRNVQHGGTGFFYADAPALPCEVEHHMPDYHLYDGWVRQRLDEGGRRRDYMYFLDYSIGFMTRGCFRKCPFCVNRRYDRAARHSSLSEFLDSDRKKICLLDDNFLACAGWEDMLRELEAAGKPYKFRQGLDERLLTDEKCRMLFSGRYDGDPVFAFDNLADAGVIEGKIRMARKYTDAQLRFYCFTGFDRGGRWDGAFWKQDIIDLLKRIEILIRYRCLPYVMRYGRYSESPYRGMYVAIARWCNQPGIFKHHTLWEFAEKDGGKTKCTYKYLSSYLEEVPEAAPFYAMKWG